MSAADLRHRIRPATRHDTPPVARLIAASFAPLDVSGWLVPPAGERVDVLARYFTIVVGHAVEHGQVDVIEDTGTSGGRIPVAAGVWLPVPHPIILGYEARMTAACGAWASRFEYLEREQARAHPQDRGAHAYLALLAVEERWQNRGLGSALLEHRLGVLDADRLPSYLEASNTRSRDLYRRNGYVDCAPVLDLPYAGEPLYPMWRDTP